MLARVRVLLLVATLGSAQTFSTLAARADAARRENRLSDAVRLYKDALRLKPSWFDGWWSLGSIYYDTDRYPECASAFSRFLALKPEVGPGHVFLGLCEFGEREYGAAVRSLLRAQQLGFGNDPQLRQVSLYHAALALIIGRSYEKATQELALALQNSPSTPAIRLAAGVAALRKPVLPDSLPEAERDLARQLGDAVAAQLERRPADAARLFEAVLAAYPKAPEVHYAFGSFLLNSDPERGLAMLRQELEITPGHVPALATIALEYLKRDDPDSAMPYAQEAAGLAPGDFVARMAYGRALLQDGEAGPAIRELESAVKLAPDSPQVRFALANAYAKAGRTADADRERQEFARLQNLINSSHQ